MRILPAKSVRKSKPAYPSRPALQAPQPGAQITASHERKTLASLQRTIDNSSRMAVQRMQIDAFQRESAQKQDNTAGLPEALRAGIENLSGLSMEGVRVHYNSPNPAQWQALAYTQGRDIYMAPGQERHLPHEAWHIVQQARGSVPAMARSWKAAINYDTALEHQADVMGARAARGTRGGTVEGSAHDVRALPTAMPANTMQFNGWKLDEFQKKLLEECPSGLCDALTAVWLGNLIRPNTEDNTIGVDDENFGKIMLLKELFFQTGANSELLTFVFRQFLAEKERDEPGSAKTWFNELSSDTLETKKEELQTYVNSQGDVIDQTVTGYTFGTEPIKYSSINKFALAVWIRKSLEPYFVPSSPKKGSRFHGLVIINAYGGDEQGGLDMAPSANHQFAIRYKSWSRQFQIMDQTRGLINLQYSNINEIPFALANYIDATYIEQPLKYAGGENSLSTLKFDLKEIMDMDLNDLENDIGNLPSYSPQKKEIEMVTKGAVIRMKLRRDA